ncbi:MAG: FAD-dependent oxidoreductase, partial [Abitibacteriaceae bacterium]|nr:FAD-dependent oxidoreductase [Abditibacteriaceae bacterium]
MYTSGVASASPTTLDQYDVVVCGGGPTGTMAAVSAARNGAKTLVIERYGFPGGSSTAAMVHPWLSFHNKHGEQVLAGLGQELVDRLQAIGGAIGHVRDSIGFVYSLTPFDPDLTKQVMLRMLVESGADLMLHTFITDVQTTNGIVTAVRVVNKSGSQLIPAKFFIDATGDADIAMRAGAPMQEQRKDGQLITQPLTMNFRLSGVQWEPIRRYILDNPDEFHHETMFHELKRGEPLTAVSGYFSEWRKVNEKLNVPRDRLLFFSGVRPDECYVNTSRVTQLDGADAFDLTAAEIEGRRQV